MTFRQTLFFSAITLCAGTAFAATHNAFRRTRITKITAFSITPFLNGRFTKFS